VVLVEGKSDSGYFERKTVKLAVIRGKTLQGKK